MLGAIVGDVIGSSYEGVDNLPTKDYNFTLLTEKSSFTDDSIMTLATAETLLYKTSPNADDFELAYLVWARRHPLVGWGKAFKAWFQSENPQPYYSFGNGSAMRVSPVGFAFGSRFDTLWGADNVKHFATQSAIPSHNHPEGIKGAQAIAAAMSLSP
jgi:ADP-ribosylglycohydrolase